MIKRLFLLLTLLSALPTYAGTITGQLQGPSGLPVKNATLTFTLNQAGLIVGTGAVANLTAQCYTDGFGNVVGAPNPTIAPNMAANYGSGALPGGTYYVTYTYLTASGQSAQSPEAQILLTGTGSIAIQPPASIPAIVTGMNVYVGTTSGGETQQGVQGTTSVFTLGTPLNSGAAPPTSNGTICSIAFNDQIIPYTGYSVSLTSSTGNAYPGWPQAWQLNGGSSGTINVSSGAPLWNGVVIYPMPILSQPLNHGPQSISGNLDFGGFNVTNVGNLTANGSFNSTFYPPTIAQAIANAGQTGSVTIPGNYQGTDAWTNPNNVRVFDQRPFNPTNSNTYTGQLTPGTTLKARDYGALCNGSNDDTAAINAATGAQVGLVGGQIQPSHPPTGPVTVELPQGTCIIRAPIVMSGYGSLVGSGSGTTLLAAEPFACNSYGCDMVQVTEPYVNPPQLSRTAGRAVRNINFQYAATATAIVGVHIFNQAGATQLTPYPAGAQYALYQLPAVTVSNNAFFALDTAVRVDDCNQCTVANNNISFVRMGIMQYGNAYSFSAASDTLTSGNGAFTPTAAPTYGYWAGGRNAYFCSNTSPGCSSGTVTPTELFPQGCGFSGAMAGFDYDVYVPNCQGLSISGGFDYGGNGGQPTVPHPAIYIGGTVLITQIVNSFVANAQCAGNGIEIGAPSANAGTSELYNDLLIENTYFTNYCTGAPSGAGVVFDAGNFYRRGAKLVDNTFWNVGYGFTVGHGLQYSVIRGNYGSFMAGTGSLINLNAGTPGATSFSGTVIADNTDSNNQLVVYDQAGGGYTLEGINQSGNTLTAPYQFLGTQRAFATGCTITSGAVGNNCTQTVSWPIPFADSTYLPSCTLQGGTGSFVSQVNIVNGSSVNAIESSILSSGTGGGTIVCTGTHN
jgi:hypothetical protein